MNAPSDTHWFWLALIVAVVVWYSTITLWVASRGALDIRTMVRRLDEENDRREGGG